MIFNVSIGCPSFACIYSFGDGITLKIIHTYRMLSIFAHKYHNPINLGLRYHCVCYPVCQSISLTVIFGIVIIHRLSHHKFMFIHFPVKLQAHRQCQLDQSQYSVINAVGVPSIYTCAHTKRFIILSTDTRICAITVYNIAICIS